MLKILEYKAADEYGLHVEVINVGAFAGMVKTAEMSNELQEAMSAIKPNPDKIYILVNALGAGEYYGSNRNGDYFPEKVLKQYHKTFEALAKVYKHHRNKDARANYGKPIFSHYNDKMHRVELVLEIDKGKDAQIEQRISSGDIKVSMGAKVPFDVCSICGHKSRKISEYCEHLRRPNLNRIQPDGRRAYAINTQPKFFDISIVLIPADKTAYMMKKVASVELATASAEVAQELFKRAKVKEAEIEKEIEGEPIAVDTDPKRLVYDSQDEIPKAELLRLLDKYGAEAVLRGLAELHIMPKPIDFQRMVLHKNKMLDLLNLMDSAKRVFPIFPETQELPFECSHPHMGDDLLEDLAPLVPDRALSKPLIIVRIMRKHAQHGPQMPKDVYIPYQKNEIAQMERSSTVKTPVYKNPAIALTALGGMYLGYSKFFKDAAKRSKLEDKFLKKPWLFPLVAFGIGATSVLGQRHREARLSEMANMKKYAASNYLTGLLVSLPASYYKAYDVGAKRRYGMPIGSVENTIAKHPLITGAAVGAAAATVMKRLTKRASASYLTDMEPSDLNELYEKLVLRT